MRQFNIPVASPVIKQRTAGPDCLWLSQALRSGCEGLLSSQPPLLGGSVIVLISGAGKQGKKTGASGHPAPGADGMGLQLLLFQVAAQVGDLESRHR